MGSGWAAMSFVESINRKKFNVTVVSPRNYFLFTPLLPSAACGAIDAESIMEPVREFVPKYKKRPFKFIEAQAVDIDIDNKNVQCISSYKYYPLRHITLNANCTQINRSSHKSEVRY